MGTILIIVCIVNCFFVVKCMHRLEEMIDLLKGLDERLHAINGHVADFPSIVREACESEET